MQPLGVFICLFLRFKSSKMLARFPEMIYCLLIGNHFIPYYGRENINTVIKANESLLRL